MRCRFECAMICEDWVPFPFNSLGWRQDLSRCKKVTEDEIWRYLGRTSCSLRQAHRGWAFKEEGFVRNVMLNEETENSGIGLLRATCTPSMRKGFYTVSAWYKKEDGRIGGAHCQCVAGLSETCHHVAAVLFFVADAAQSGVRTCTDLPCAWIVPSQGKKVPSPRPLQEIHFQKHLVHKPARECRRRIYNPCEEQRDNETDAYKDLLEDMGDHHPSMLWFRHAAPNKDAVVPKKPSLPISDDANLSTEGAVLISKEFQRFLRPLTDEERNRITLQTMNQSENKEWHKERIGRLTSSLFKRIVKCRTPDGLLKQLLYPKDSAYSEAIAYGRRNESVAVRAYCELMAAQDRNVSVHSTGLHVHSLYPFIAASPDRTL
ncbi:uncharacterized protein LOC135387654 [Ornithodoros turicata]|uniref:uncharacterized protein LOC135387654 n=1 Tax=Ornithodoros turicata TaxID=34597 RepID=UPI003138FA4E